MMFRPWPHHPARPPYSYKIDLSSGFVVNGGEVASLLVGQNCIHIPYMTVSRAQTVYIH